MHSEPGSVQVRLLGSVDIVLAGEARPLPGLRRKSLLAALALERGRIVSTDRLIDIVWGDAAPAGRENTLQRHVSYLRQTMGSRNVIVSRPPGYLMDLPPGSVDAERAASLMQRAQQSADPADRVHWTREALRLFRGASLIEVHDSPWLREQAQRLDGLRAQAVRAMVDGRLALGQHAELLPELEQLIRDHPLDEHVYGQLILALYRSGRQADALDAYGRLRRRLGDELGIDVGPELRRLEVAILRQDAGLAAPERPRPPEAGRLPRLGGAPLVGRERELAVLRSLVDAAARESGGTAFIVGEPGIGKTRLTGELARYAEQRGLRVFRGRAALPQVQFRPLTEALQSAIRRFGLPADDRLLPYRYALARLVPQLRETPRLREAAPAAPDESPVILAEAVLRLVTVLSGGDGCLLVLEDLHDADADTLAIVDYLVDNAHAERLLLLGTCRRYPAAALAVARGARQRRAGRLVELSRLSEHEVRELAAGCLGVAAGQLPEPVAGRLLSSADGLPLHVEELLAGFADDGTLSWAAGRWEVSGPLDPAVPPSLGETLAARVERLGADARAVLRAGALFGRQFPSAAAGAAAGVSGARLLDGLTEAVAHQLVSVQDDDPHWYSFRHAMTAEALRSAMLPADRADLARRAAQFLAEAAVGRFHGSDQLLAELWSTASEPALAATRLVAAGRQASVQGAVATAIVLLERALSMVERDLSGELATDLGEALVSAYAAAGRVGDAYALGAGLARSVLPGRQASLHLRLAEVATAAGDWTEARYEIGEARLHAGPAPARAVAARLDAIEAQVAICDATTPDRLGRARRLAGRALRAAVEIGRPETSCSALDTLGRCARLHDLAEADVLYERGLTIATAHNLIGWRINFLYQLGTDEGIRDGDPRRLVEALSVARQAGTVVTALDIELELSVVRLCRGEAAAAADSAARCERDAARLRLDHIRLEALGVRIMAAAHQGQRAVVAELLDAFRARGGEQDDLASAVHGFGVVFCHLLHSDTGRALAEADLAAEQEGRRPAAYVSYLHGPRLFLAVLAGRAGDAECARVASSAQAQARWNRQFVPLAGALLAGRGGRRADAEAAVAEFLVLSRPYPLARHLGLRLVAPEAAADGWGEPPAWQRAADSYLRGLASATEHSCPA
ncbi:BTAD domain-containing putative transcriptional regulator [Amorphoplanes digitatis]|uniref:DNA-binding SARP family transcriptional activator n=1 Tax=Actinoplanes digitatis TaxID=1868 RepID=A0A7W7I223_9ACTN|nr:AfsR/SARP family transcriptional regulator [Actinoplanes digitatis]MBB4764838.1 DNA-binding SARP family transcriptional activator [Actinoplanes digitatis]